MIGFKEGKGMFFDAPKVVAAVDAATRKVLSKFGAFVRTAAKSSIRKRKRASAPGSPPSSHTGLLKKFIYFGYDTAARSVVIGPVRLASGDTPERLEYGGAVTLKKDTVMRVGKPGRDKSGRFTDSPRVVVKAGTRLDYKPRPFMHPALKKELPKLPAMWANSVKP